MAALIDRVPSPDPSRSTRFRALVVVTDPGARSRVVRGIQALGAVDVIEAASIGEARVRARGTGPRELLVLDVGLPDGSGLDLLAELRAAGWSRAVVLSPLEDPYTVRGALAAGVRAFVVTSANPSLEDLGSGHRFRSAGVAGLSARELEVLSLVADGQSNRAIGLALELSSLTVKSHLARIARKLGTGDRAEMVLMSLRAGAIA